jgi:glycosyltransferase involved in cell wall biosynthesis
MNVTTNPLISVVMPVHNALPFLGESIRSILEQTLTEFEFVIHDDASTDGSTEVLREWSRKDSRIRLFESEIRLGLTGSSNAVVSKARAAIVARMDADDISHPDRLKRQWEIIKSQPKVAVVGTLYVGIDDMSRVVRPRDRWRLVRRSRYIPFPHGSAMFRRNVFDQVGGYAREAERGEDQDLFSRMSAQGSVVTLPDMLYSYRYHSGNATLLNGIPVDENHSETYLLAAMRLWSGNRPMLLQPLLAKKLRWNAKALMVLASAVLGEVSPAGLRFFLRSSIRARDFLAGLRVKDGSPYEWRSR